jgi:hypothetical protein
LINSHRTCFCVRSQFINSKPQQLKHFRELEEVRQLRPPQQLKQFEEVEHDDADEYGEEGVILNRYVY